MAAAATRDIPLNQMPVQLLEFAYGIVVSLIMAFLLVKYLHLPKQTFTFTFHLKEAIRQDPRMVVDSFYYASVLFEYCARSESLFMDYRVLFSHPTRKHSGNYFK